jgi:hypothetical protein
MTILAELRAEVRTAWQRSPTQTVLWLDPQREWERLLDQLAAELELVKYAGSQLELRVKIELGPAQQPRIVYGLLPRQALSVLKEYEFTLPVWDEALLHTLRRWGVGIERDEEKSLLPLLPGLAARWFCLGGSCPKCSPNTSRTTLVSLWTTWRKSAVSCVSAIIPMRMSTISGLGIMSRGVTARPLSKPSRGS